MNVQRLSIALALVAYMIATVVYGLHAYESNPQYDNQGMRYAQEGVIAATTGTLGTFFLEERKYPLLYALPFAVTFETMLVVHGGDLSDADLYLASRIISLLFALGTFIVLWRLAKRMKLGTDPVLLLATSLLFLLFTSAIRPHVTVAFWTLLAVLTALRAKERAGISTTALSFACAAVAFATLQSGLFAFIFPLWVVLERPLSLKAIGRCVPWLGFALMFALMIGYPFLLRPLFGLQREGGIDLGHDVGLHFALLQPLRIVWQLLWSEPILFITAAFGLRIVRSDDTHPLFRPILLYVALYLLTFGFHTISAGRFFLPIFPMLALVGALALHNTPRWVRPTVAGFVILMSLRLTWLAALPNTYADMATFLDSRPPYTVILVQPDEFFPLDRNKLATEREHAPLTNTIVLPDYSDKPLPPMAKAWSICHTSHASNTTDEIVLLWNDTPLALWHLFEARRLGPNMRAYCSP